MNPEPHLARALVMYDDTTSLAWTEYAQHDPPDNKDRLPFDTPDGLALLRKWCATPADQDGMVSGVLADWIEDHVDLWPGRDVAPFIRALRRRFTLPGHNHTA